MGIRSIFGAGGGGNGNSVVTLDEAKLRGLLLEIAAMSENEEVFKERIAELELAIDDSEWTGLGSSDGFQFDRTTIDKLVRLSRLYYLKNPAIKRPVDLQAAYVWGQGVSIYSNVPAVDEVIRNFLSDPSNMRSFSSKEAFMDQERRLRVDGNLFWRFFIDPSTGRVQVRKLPLEQVRAVVCNPDDADEPLFYIRSQRKSGKDVRIAYPDWRYWRYRRYEQWKNKGRYGVRSGFSMDILKDYDDAVIEWETPVMHYKTGAFGDWDFGIPETYAAIDWARAYKELLEAYKKTINSLARWAWKMKAGGGQAQLDALAATIGTTFGTTGDSLTETNPTPTAGSIWAYTGDSEMKPIDVSKAYVNPDGFRRVLLMVSSAMGMPEVYYGAAEGTFATAKVMDRPTELSFISRQSMWAGIIRDILEIVVEAAALAPGREGISSGGYDDYGRMRLMVDGRGIDYEIIVDFPPILQVDVQSFIQALTTFTTQNGQAIQALNDGPTLYRLALTALGVDDVERIVEVFYPKDGGESRAEPIQTFTAPPTPQDVASTTPLGSQPQAQGAAGAGNEKRQGRGGPNALARKESQDDEAKARIEFMRALLDMRREMQEKERDET